MEIDKNVYIPKSARKALYMLGTIPHKPHLADEGYSNLILQPALILNFKGNKPRQAFQGFGVYLIDYGGVGKFYADVAIRKCYYYVGEGDPLRGPQRFSVCGERLYPLTIKEFNAYIDAMNKNNERKEK